MIHLESDPLKLSREIDWVIKYHLIEAYREKHDLPLTHPRVALLDLAYHDVTPAAFALLPARAPRPGRPHRRPTRTSSIAMDTPPQTTRARLRGAFIKKAKERKRDYTVDWVHLKLNDQAQRTVLCKDPFKSRDERVERLIASCNRRARAPRSWSMLVRSTHAGGVIFAQRRDVELGQDHARGTGPGASSRQDRRLLDRDRGSTTTSASCRRRGTASASTSDRTPTRASRST